MRTISTVLSREVSSVRDVEPGYSEKRRVERSREWRGDDDR